jgi:hypothetical protein
MSGKRGSVVLVAVIAALLAAIGSGAAAPVGPPAPYAPHTFTTAGQPQVYAVPPGVSVVRVTAVGGHGGAGGYINGQRGTGGRGATVTADIQVPSGSRLLVQVGAEGLDAASPHVSGAYGGGAGGGVSAGRVGGGTGGGASQVSLCPFAAPCDTASPTAPLVVAAGGGGGGECRLMAADCFGGDAGAAGSQPSAGGSGGPGGGATTGAGGYGGTAGAPTLGQANSGAAGSAGARGQGGAGANGSGSDGQHAGGAGGGGGGGYFGGGGGGSGAASSSADGYGEGGGGGGGSSYIVPGSRSVQTGLAAITTPTAVRITPWLPTDTTVSCAKRSLRSGGSDVCTATVTAAGGAGASGAISWTLSGGGALTSASCTLTGGSCTTTLTTSPTAQAVVDKLSAAFVPAFPYLPSGGLTAVRLGRSGADLALHQKALPMRGGRARFVIQVQNNGPQTARQVAVSELLSAPARVALTVRSAGGAPCATASVVPAGAVAAATCRIPKLAARAKARVVLIATGATGTPVQGTAGAHAKSPADVDTGNDTATVNTWLGPVTGLTLSGTAEPSKTLGAAAFALSLANHGPDAARGTTLQAKLASAHPIQISAIDAAPGTCTINGPLVQCSLPAGAKIPARGAWNVQIHATGTASAPVSMTASFTPGTGINPGTAPQPLTLSTWFSPQPQADLQVKVEANLTQKKRDKGKRSNASTTDTRYTLTVRITVHNAGPATATNLVLGVDPGLPAEIPPAGCTRCTDASLAPGATWTVTVKSSSTFRAPLNGAAIATVTAAEHDPDPADDIGQANWNTGPAPGDTVTPSTAGH